MNRRGVAFKLFAITALFFFLFYAVVLIGQLFFFDKFYQYQKTAALEKKLQAFGQKYAQGRWDDDRISREMALFINQNKAQLAIVNPEGKIKYDNSFRVVIQDDSGRAVRISLSFLINSGLKELLQANLSIGDRIEVLGVYDNPDTKDFFFPAVIQKAGAKEIGSITSSGIAEPLERLGGVITDALLPHPNQWNLRQGLLFLALDEWFPLSPAKEAELQSGKRITEEWTETISGTRGLVSIQPVVAGGKVSELVFVVASLQQISEAYDALRLFYLYLAVGGIALIVLLSLLFSKLVTKPLLSLNKIALRMAKLDFSVKSQVKGSDEIGSLSDSLNSLSETLDNTLRELYEANERLKTDMEHKLRMEQMQKEFISNASHELKTPLSIVRGFVEGVKDGVSEGKRERYLEVILDETEKMENLVKDMLELTKLESQKTKPKKLRYSLSEQMEDIADKLSHHLSEKELQVVTVTSDEQPVHADPVKIEQVLFNLLMNAIRHASAGTEITVRIEKDGERIRLSIENEGEKLPEDQLDRVWERFYRVERSRNRKTGGTGLGLAIVKYILDMHDSRYGVMNTERGVSFYFDLEL
ncbi:sensor histidine kinase [Paenibacillus oceani]|uniref:histidine kinase n=1 Tax=Paenibacillus oceani TaxID=2772510 RepID=A0A927CDG3_9BACL|nr:ATP-binding protein [Paenibacillus oceani]MBD2863921.1 HAMP domain-containing protein [Paenibacillus oceani]